MLSVTIIFTFLIIIIIIIIITDGVLLYALVGHYWLCPHAPPNWTLGPMARDVQELWPFIMQ